MTKIQKAIPASLKSLKLMDLANAGVAIRVINPNINPANLFFFSLNTLLPPFLKGSILSTHFMYKRETKNQPIRLPGLKPGVRSGLILSGAFYPDLKIGVWRRRTYQDCAIYIKRIFFCQYFIEILFLDKLFRPFQESNYKTCEQGSKHIQPKSPS